jgi:DNA-binding response OmpR family regulator
VPASSKPSAGAASQSRERGILLLESYDALAAALGSALKKFAPEHKIDIAASLADAEKLAAKNPPELFVIDADPPWPGITDFVATMREKNPTARGLVIGAAIPDEIAAERKLSGALQFIAKPFELSAFGAAVQALLGPWRESESNRRRGNLGELNAIDLLLLHHAAEANVIVDLSAGPNFAGEIHLAGGQVSHAATANLTGLQALREILSWSDARVSERKGLVGHHREVLRGWISLVVELLHSREPVAVAPPAARDFVEPTKRKKVVIIDDTEMLLVFVEDALMLAAPELQITTAATSSDGLKKIQEIVPDLVLIDYSLPDFNGDEVCRRLLQNERTAAIPVLMMSAHGPAMAAAAKRLPNIVATIEKPFFSKQLVDLVQRALSAPKRAREPAARDAGTSNAPQATDAIRESRIAPAAAKAVITPPPKQDASSVAHRATSTETQAASPKVPLRTADTTAATAPPRRPVAPLPQRAMQRTVPTIKPPPPPILQPPRVAPKPAEVRLPPTAATETVLSLYLEVVSLQVTPQFEMRSIRARPAPGAVALRLASGAANLGVARESGFQLGATQLDVNGHISLMRLVPNSKPFQPAQIRTAFQIGSVAVVPGATHQRVQLTTAGTTPMMLQIVARPEVAGVKLSPAFQVGELVLKWRTNAVRVTLDPKAPGESGALFETSAVQLDSAGRIVELLLNPVK